MNLKSLDVPAILSYGTIGLGFLLAFLAYLLLTKEQAKPRPVSRIITAIYVFMAFSALLVGFGFFSEIIKATGSPTRLATNNQNWLSIDGVEGPRELKFRVIANVSGTQYSYPPNIIWASPGTDQSAEFPLDIRDEKLKVSFKAYVQDKEGKIISYESRSVIDISEPNGTSQRYVIARVDPGDLFKTQDTIYVIYRVLRK